MAHPRPRKKKQQTTTGNGGVEMIGMNPHTDRELARIMVFAWPSRARSVSAMKAAETKPRAPDTKISETMA